MPKLRESPGQRMDRVFRAAVQYGLARKAEDMEDLARMAPGSRSTVYRRVRSAQTCTNQEMLFYAPRFLNDRQLCEMYGVEYHGATPPLLGACHGT